MSTLFTLSSSWFKERFYYENLCFAQPGDTILLMQDAVLALHSPISLASFVAKCKMNKINLAALADDLILRGIESRYSDIKAVDYAGFVQLVAAHDQCCEWHS